MLSHDTLRIYYEWTSSPSIAQHRQTSHACLVTVCILAPLDWTRTGGSCPGWTMRHASAATEKKSVASICLVIDHRHQLDTEPEYNRVHGVWSRHHHGLGDRSVVTLHWFLTLTSSSRFQLHSQQSHRATPTSIQATCERI